MRYLYVLELLYFIGFIYHHIALWSVHCTGRWISGLGLVPWVWISEIKELIYPDSTAIMSQLLCPPRNYLNRPVHLCSARLWKSLEKWPDKLAFWVCLNFLSIGSFLSVWKYIIFIKLCFNVSISVMYRNRKYNLGFCKNQFYIADIWYLAYNMNWSNTVINFTKS